MKFLKTSSKDEETVEESLEANYVEIPRSNTWKKKIPEGIFIEI